MKTEQLTGPVKIKVEQYKLESILEALESGVEYAQEALIDHDSSLGRTTRRNRRAAESMEKDIELAKDAFGSLDAILNPQF